MLLKRLFAINYYPTIRSVLQKKEIGMPTLFFKIGQKSINLEISPELHKKMRIIALNLDISLIQIAHRCWQAYHEVTEEKLNQYLMSFGQECKEEPDIGEMGSGEIRRSD